MPLAKSLKDTFGEVVRYAAEVEKDGHTMSRDIYIQGCDLDLALRAHSDLVATNPQYNDLFKAFKATGVEIDTLVTALPMDKIDALVDKLFAGEEVDVGPESALLEARYEQQQKDLFAIYQQTLTP